MAHHSLYAKAWFNYLPFIRGILCHNPQYIVALHCNQFSINTSVLGVEPSSSVFPLTFLCFKKIRGGVRDWAGGWGQCTNMRQPPHTARRGRCVNCSGLNWIGFHPLTPGYKTNKRTKTLKQTKEPWYQNCKQCKFFLMSGSFYTLNFRLTFSKKCIQSKILLMFRYIHV